MNFTDTQPIRATGNHPLVPAGTPGVIVLRYTNQGTKWWQVLFVNGAIGEWLGDGQRVALRPRRGEGTFVVADGAFEEEDPYLSRAESRQLASLMAECDLASQRE